ncbi:MAG: dihydropteroate synthase [Elusimicrobia bacterium]|nr:dihydropteroate synthase [Elusimicrobiota bacterium]
MRSSRARAPEVPPAPEPPRFRAPRLMGVVNATPDSFHAASRAPSRDAAVARALRLVEDGADLLDVGGESTRPGSDPVPPEDELARVVPVVAELARRVKVPISVDTRRARVAAAALDAGATIVNDVTALRGDPEMARTAARAERVVLMHMLGDSPKTMQDDPRYADAPAEVAAFLEERVAAFAAAGGDPARVWVDPGIGFGKTLAHNLALLKRVGGLSRIAPVVLGVSRKSFLGRLRPDSGPEARLPGSLAAAAWAGFCGVEVLRVHDVAETRRALEVLTAVAGADA